MNKLGRFAFALVGFSAAMGFRFYNKSATAKEVKTEMMAICSTNSGCHNAINTHFKDCFDSSFSMRGRRRSSSLDTAKLASCINSKSGANYFAAY